jgi:hypothetical protein
MFGGTLICSDEDDRQGLEPQGNPPMDTKANSVRKLQAQLTQDVDKLRKGLQSMPFQKRLQIQEEVHGVADPCPIETLQMIKSALKTMQEQLDDIWYKPIYDKISPSSYLHTKEFRLRLLRCELFDCKKAAERLIRFTEYMKEEWGFEYLERPLMLSDLENGTGNEGCEIMKFLRSGYTQILPFRDRSGRAIIFAHAEACGCNKLNKVSSLLHYMLMFVFVH